MFIRQSALTFSAALSARSRSITARRSAISRALVRWGLSHPFFCQSAKLIIGSDDEHLRLAQDGRQEMVAGAHLLRKLLGWVDSGAHVTPKAPLSVGESRHYLTKGNVSNDEEIDIARGADRSLRC